MRRSWGFTLIELMVVVSIIAILVAIAISGYSTFQKNSRDVRRKSDLATIQSALEQYHADQGNYPSIDKVRTDNSLTDPDGNKTYLNKIPGDPLGGTTDYAYYPLPIGCDNQPTYCTSYRICAMLENLPGGGSCTDGSARNYEARSP